MTNNNWKKVKKENNVLELIHNSEFYRAYIYDDDTLELIVRDRIDEKGRAEEEKEINIPNIDEMINMLIELKKAISVI